MRTKPFSAAVAAAALASLLGAAPAAADEPLAECRLDAAPVAGGFAGVLSGHILHLPGGGVAIRCELWVATARACSTPTGTGEWVATTARECFFQPAASYQTTAYITTAHGTTTVTRYWRPWSIDCGVC